MFFRRSVEVSELYLDTKEKLVFDYGGVHKIVVTVEPLLKDGKNSIDARCVLEFQADPPRKVGPMFEALAVGKLPAGSKIERDVEKTSGMVYPPIADDGTIESGYAVPLEMLPPPFREFLKTWPSLTQGLLDRTISVLRWRCAAPGPQSPKKNGHTEWSLDGVSWNEMPSDWGFELHTLTGLRLRAETRAEVLQLV